MDKISDESIWLDMMVWVEELLEALGAMLFFCVLLDHLIRDNKSLFVTTS